MAGTGQEPGVTEKVARKGAWQGSAGVGSLAFVKVLKEGRCFPATELWLFRQLRALTGMSQGPQGKAFPVTSELSSGSSSCRCG